MKNAAHRYEVESSGDDEIISGVYRRETLERRACPCCGCHVVVRAGGESILRCPVCVEERSANAFEKVR